jgi:hypothetical protein
MSCSSRAGSCCSGSGTREAAALVGHIDALLDLDDEVSLGSQR